MIRRYRFRTSSARARSRHAGSNENDKRVCERSRWLRKQPLKRDLKQPAAFGMGNAGWGLDERRSGCIRIRLRPLRRDTWRASVQSGQRCGDTLVSSRYEFGAARVACRLRQVGFHTILITRTIMQTDRTAAEFAQPQGLSGALHDADGDARRPPVRALARAAFCFAWVFGLEPFLTASTDNAPKLGRH